MGFGVDNKCIMKWNNDEDVVWPEDLKWSILMTPEDETSGAFTTFLSTTKAKGKPVIFITTSISDPDSTIISRLGIGSIHKRCLYISSSWSKSWR